MKKQNQIERKTNRTKSSLQGKKPARKQAAEAGDPAAITLVATPKTGLPGVIYKRGVVETGRLNWKSSEFEEALSQGRFLITVLNQFHRIALELANRWCDYEAFLEVAADSHIQTLRGSVPIYWIETHDECRNVSLISVRGQTPGQYLNDPRAAKDARALENEIQCRALENDLAGSRSRKIAALSNKFIRAPRGDLNTPQLRLLQIAYIAAHSSSQELSEFCNVMEAIMEPGSAETDAKGEIETRNAIATGTVVRGRVPFRFSSDDPRTKKTL